MKMEMKKVPEAGFEIEGLWISGFHRGQKLRNLSFPFKLISSLFKAKKIIEKKYYIVTPLKCISKERYFLGG